MAWEAREPKAYLVSDDKAHRPKAHRQGLSHPKYLAVHRAVMCTRCASNATRAARRPFSEHARHRATIYAHGFHFNSVRMRRLSLLGGAVIAGGVSVQGMVAAPRTSLGPLRADGRDVLRPSAHGRAAAHLHTMPKPGAWRSGSRPSACAPSARTGCSTTSRLSARVRAARARWPRALGGDGPHPAVTVPNAVPNAVPRAVPHAVPRAAPSMASLKASSAAAAVHTTHGVRP